VSAQLAPLDRAGRQAIRALEQKAGGFAVKRTDALKLPLIAVLLAVVLALLVAILGTAPRAVETFSGSCQAI